jgi:hypothetical protein
VSVAGNAIQELRRQHELLVRLADLMVTSVDCERARDRLSGLLIDVVTAHAIVEREVLYPTIDCPRIRVTVDCVLAQHEMMVTWAEELTDAGVGFETAIHGLRRAIGLHVREAERDLFQFLERAVDSHDLDLLGAAIHGRFVQEMRSQVELFGAWTTD